MITGIQPHWSETIGVWASEQSLVIEVYAFGSRVKGGYSPESDLDIAVDVAGADEGEKLGNWMFLEPQWTVELQAMLPVRLHIQCMLPDDKVVTPAVKDHGFLIYRAPNV